jgi:hypothetical protein
LIELLDFLPPQKTVLRVSFSEEGTGNKMEIVVREHSAAVVSRSRKEISGARALYLPKSPRVRNRTTFVDLDFPAAEILEENIERWFSYLLSRFESKYRLSPIPQPAVSPGPRIGATFDEASG